MPPDTSAGLPQLIAAAVTPVVLISASATLILGINNKHQSMSERIRSLTAEYRQADTTGERRKVIQLQIVCFRRRVMYSAAAHRLLYLSIILFLVMILIILAPAHLSYPPAAYVLLVCGITTMLIAVAFEFSELWSANQTLELEYDDIPDPN